MYAISEVDGVTFADEITRFNALVLEWPRLLPHHFMNGFWWLAFLDDEPVAFAGMVEMLPFPNTGYLKRCFVCPDHHGRGLQFRLMCARELKARQLGWTLLVSECLESNIYSAANFRRSSYDRFEPEQKWGDPNSIYWQKHL